MPRRIRQFFNSLWETVPPELGLVVGMPAVVAILPWVPPDARVPLSKIVHSELEKLELSRGAREDPLFEELKAISPNKSLSETLEEVQRVMDQFKQKQWRIGGRDGNGTPIADIVAETASKISQYSSILEPLTQAIPFVPPVVWGAFSMFMKMAMDDAEMGTKLMYFINSYMEASDIYTTYWRLYQHSRVRSSQKVRDLIGLLEEDIHKFAYAARKYYFNKKNSVVRILGSTTVPFSVEFQPVCDGIRDRTNSLKLAIEAAKQDERKRHEVLNWISKVPYQDAHTNSARKRESDTCEWLRKKEHFLKWRNSSVSSVLWVHGNAGFGKTILMSSVVDYLQENLPNGSPRHNHVAYFYCNHDKKEMLDTLVILGSILKQIVSSLPDIPDKVLNRFEHHKHLGKPGVLHLDAIRELLIASIQQASSAVFILIDGLDECDMAIRTELLETLIPLTLASGPIPSKMAKICILSRPYDDIRECLTDKFLEIPILKADNKGDMVKFLISRINSSRSLQEALQTEPRLRTQVIQVLVNKAEGVFLWISLQQVTLCRERDPRSIKRYLKDLPNSLDMEESYLRLISLILSESPGNRQLAETVLGWVLCAVRPLSVGELTGVLCFLGLFQKGLEELKRDIIQVCHGLIHIEKRNDIEYVCFIHFSAHQFLCDLLEQSCKSNPRRRNSFGLHDMSAAIGRGNGAQLEITISRVHYEMAQTCMKCISQDGLNKALLGADEAYNCQQELDSLIAENPFLLYASQAWVQHLHATDDKGLTDTCLKLFQKEKNLELAFQLFWFQKFVERFPRGSTPLHIASYFGLPHIISSLLEGLNDTKDLNLIADKQHRTPIYWAAYHGDLASLEKLGLVTSRDCKLTEEPLQRALGEALLAAIEGDQVNLIGVLLSNGADPNVHVRGGKNALFHATLKGDSSLPVVQQLVDAGAKIEPEAPTASPLEAAVMAGALDITRYFVSLNIDVNVRSHDPPGHPLRIAVFGGQHEMAELLLNSGADITLSDESELIEVASMMGDHNMMDIILQHAPSLCILESEDSTLANVLSHDHSTPGSPLSPCSPRPSQLTPKSKASQLRGLRTGYRHAMRFIKMGNMGQETIGKLFPRVQRIMEKKFDTLDFPFLEALETIFPELVDELLRVEPTALFLETGSHSFAEVLIHMRLKLQGRQQAEYYERFLHTLGSAVMRLIDGGCQGHFRTVRLNTEKQLMESIEKDQAQRVEALFAEVEVGMHVGVVMERHALWLRGSAKTYLSGIMALIPSEGSARFTKFLEGVALSGLNSQGDRARSWRKMVMFIEIAYCTYAYRYQNLYSQIQLKLAGLRKALKGNSEITPDGAMMDQLGTIMHGGRLDWHWDADEDPWWHPRKK